MMKQSLAKKTRGMFRAPMASAVLLFAIATGLSSCFYLGPLTETGVEDILMQKMLKNEEPYVSQRFALFARRVPQYVVRNPDAVIALIKDDAAFERFLREDAYAMSWLSSNGGPKAYTTDYDTWLHPVTTPVLPGTGS